MLKRIAYILSIILLLNFSFYSQSLQENLKKIDSITNDSVALISLKNLLKNTSDFKDLLNINIKIIMRANSSQRYTLAMSVGNENQMIAHKNGLDSLEATFLKLIGVTNYYMDQKRAAVPYFEKALAIAEKNNYWELEASCHNNIGGALADVQEYTLAEPHLLKSIAIMTKNGKENSATGLRTVRVLARVYSQNNKLDKAEALYLALIEKSKTNNDTALLCDNLLYYAELLSDRGEVEKAVEMSGKALAFRRKRNNLQELQGALEMHSKNLARVGRYKEGAELMQEASYLVRSTFKKDLEKEIGEIEVKYKTEQIKQEKEFAELKNKKQKQIYLFSIIGLIIITAAGFFVWNQQKKSKHLTELAEIEKSRFKDVIEAEEKERSRIAQELHDGLGQLLSTARLNVAGLEDSVSSEDKAGLDRSLKIIDDACMEVRNISHNMMPSALIRLGLIPAINELVNNINSGKGVQIDFNTNVESSLGKSLDITIYRVVQEILNNMIRHAKATSIIMTIEKNESDLKITMKDNGVGFNTEELKNSKGIGWKNIYSRISMLDGDIKLESVLQKGTLVFINLKLKNG